MTRHRHDLAAVQRALDALALSRREHVSLTKASRLTRTTPRTVLRYAGSGYRHEGRRYIPRDFDRIPRELTVLTESGPRGVVARDSRTASAIAKHASAVGYYLETGDTSRLEALTRTTFLVNGQPIRLPIDPDVLDRLAEGGELHYELYRV